MIGVVDSLLKAHERGDKASTEGLLAVLDRRQRSAGESPADARDQMLLEIARALYGSAAKPGT